MATVNEAPAKRRKKSTSDSNGDQGESVIQAWNAGDDFSDAPATEEAAPKRTRKAKANAPVINETEAVAPAEKPTRSRKKAATETPVTVAEATPAVETADETPAPKRSRKKAEAEPQSLLEIAGEKPSTQAADAVVAEAPVETPVALPDEAAQITFAELGLSDALLKSITAVGYEEPTPIQLGTIPVLLAGKDVIAQAQTGSGKTAAFGLPDHREHRARKQRNVQALILCPTRELAIQVAEALHKYGRHKEVETLPIYGGQPYERQFRGLQRGPQIVVGTPGRVMDHMRRGKRSTLDTSSSSSSTRPTRCSTWASSRISSGSCEQVPAERQTALFSATMPPRIVELAAALHERARADLGRRQADDRAGNDQTFYEVPRKRKIDALTRILDAEAPPLAMIFCRTKHGGR